MNILNLYTFPRRYYSHDAMKKNQGLVRIGYISSIVESECRASYPSRDPALAHWADTVLSRMAFTGAACPSSLLAASIPAPHNCHRLQSTPKGYWVCFAQGWRAQSACMTFTSLESGPKPAIHCAGVPSSTPLL